MNPSREPVELEKGWAFMEEGFTKLKTILASPNPDRQFTSEEYMLLYTTIYNMCTQKPPHDYSEKLYERYRGLCEDYINSVILVDLRQLQREDMLKKLVLHWKNYKIIIKWFGRFFQYLNRYFVPRRSLPDLNTVGITTFKELVFNNEQFRQGVIAQILTLIDMERDGEQVDHSVLKAAVNMYVEVGLGEMNFYETDCEEQILKNTTVYYSRKAAALIVQDSCPEYMVKAEESLKREKDRVSNYLHPSTETKLLENVQHELLTTVSSQLLDKEHSGCRALLRDDKVDDLSRMYRLFSKINQGLDPVALTFKQHVTDEGLALLKKAEDAASNKKAENRDVVGLQEQNFVRDLIELYDKYLAYVTTCFANHTLFHKSLKEAFEVFCNKTVAGTSSAELLATFCDSLLKNKEKQSDDAMEETMEKVVKLLAFISDKDLFAEFLRKKLAKLLMAKGHASDDNDIEKNLLSKLKQQYGGQYTSKMEGMVTDMTLARENAKCFRDEYLPNLKINNPTGGVSSFTPRVLTTGFWPTYKSSDLNLPAEMVKCVEVFLDYYKTKTKHRKLTWVHSLGQCNVNGHFDAKKFEIGVSTYQAATLLLFNASDKLSYQEIKEQLNLSDEDVKRSLHSLSCAKYKILTKEPNNKTISDTDVFEFNAKFTDRSTRFKVPLPPLSDERKKVVEDVGKDRQFAIDACLVRIMKSRKVLGYQQLVMECVDQLSKMFKPDIKMIKKRIEDLITRDYLERDAENSNTFKYLA